MHKNKLKQNQFSICKKKYLEFVPHLYFITETHVGQGQFKMCCTKTQVKANEIKPKWTWTIWVLVPLLVADSFPQSYWFFTQRMWLVLIAALNQKQIGFFSFANPTKHTLWSHFLLLLIMALGLSSRSFIYKVHMCNSLFAFLWQNGRRQSSSI